MPMPQAYIVRALRTAGAATQRRLRQPYTCHLAASGLNGLVKRSDIDPAMIEDVHHGLRVAGGPNSLKTLHGTAILALILPESGPGVSVDRQCGSSQQALHLALLKAVMSGTQESWIAEGVENMTRVDRCYPPQYSGRAKRFGKLLKGAGHQDAPLTPTFLSQFTGAEPIAVWHTRQVRAS